MLSLPFDKLSIKPASNQVPRRVTWWPFRSQQPTGQTTLSTRIALEVPPPPLQEACPCQSPPCPAAHLLGLWVPESLPDVTLQARKTIRNDKLRKQDWGGGSLSIRIPGACVRSAEESACEGPPGRGRGRRDGRQADRGQGSPWQAEGCGPVYGQSSSHHHPLAEPWSLFRTWPWHDGLVAACRRGAP